MKKRMLMFLGGLLFAGRLLAVDEVLRQAQEELKRQGFYFGEVTGEASAANTSAIKRFQIRQGLEVSGTLDAETLGALGVEPSVPAPETPPPAPKPEMKAPAGNPPVPEGVVPNPAKSAQGRSAAPLDLRSDYATLFAKTPFATAPLEVQVSTVRRVQQSLNRAGFFDEPIDGRVSPILGEALLAYQRRSRLPLTGRLDLSTLNQMRLLPGRGGPPTAPFNEVPQSRPGTKTYRGIWVP